MRHRCLVALLLATTSPAVSATAVVVFRNADGVVLAADSLEQLPRDGTRTVCKIRQAGPWWYALAGFMRSEHPTLDLFAEIERVLPTATTLADVGRVLHDTVFPRMRAVLEDPKAATAMHKWWSIGETMSAIVVVGPSGVGVLKTVVTSTAPVVLAATWTDGVTRAQFVVADITDIAGSDAATARQMVAAAVVAEPKMVGGPIDVLTIGPRGAAWFARDTASRCAAL